MNVYLVLFLVSSHLRSIEVIADKRRNETIVNNYIERNGRLWPIWPVGLVKFENALCASADGFDGTCYTRKQCNLLGGIISGKCASDIGSCCIVQNTCGSSTSHNNSYFVNPSFPSSYPGGSSCTLTVQKCNPDICQIRIDFLRLTLAQPDANGNCIYDALNVVWGGTQVRPICGENAGQHLYLDFNGDDDIQIIIDTSASVSFPRSWSLKISQLACDCQTKAPAGCLMYYPELRGVVRSFNYGTMVSGGNNGAFPGTRELSNLNYGVCIGMVPGYCSIQWRQSSGDPYSFTVSNHTTFLTNDLPTSALSGEDCRQDFVVIPKPYIDGVPAHTDRFCGNSFPTLRTSSKPFVLTVVTNEGEIFDHKTFDAGNRGFSLEYTQLSCSSSQFG